MTLPQKEDWYFHERMGFEAAMNLVLNFPQVLKTSDPNLATWRHSKNLHKSTSID